MTASFWGQALQIAAKDLRVEARAGEALLIAAPFGAVALLVIPLAIGPEIPLLARIGPGLYWAIVLLFGMLVALRQTASEGPAQLDLLALLGVDPAARFIGRVMASGLLLLAFELILLPVMLVLYDPALPGWWWLPVVIPLVAMGLALLGTLASQLTANLRVRATLAPLLVAPLAAPILLAASAPLEGLRYGRDMLPWVLLLVTVVLVLALVGVGSARSLEEGTR